MKQIKVLGPGCYKCQKLLANAQAAVDQLGLKCEVEKITDISEIMKHGVMMTPGLVVDGEVKSSGKVLGVEAIKQVLAG
jgi:small redox-active disulfide protein 2